MKRSLSVSLVLILMTFGLPAKSNAATDGCPDTWSIDTGSDQGLTELTQVKQKLGVDMALSDGILEFSDFAGEIGLMKEPKKKSFDEEDLYLYGKTLVFQTYTVQVKNCPARTQFKFSKGSLAEFLTSYKINILESDPATWALNTQNAFIDFTQNKSFPQCLDNIANSIRANFQNNMKLNLNRPYQQSQWQSQLQSTAGGNLIRGLPAPCGLSNYGLLGIQMTEGCKLILRDSPRGNIFGANVKTGSICNFGIAVFKPGSGGRVSSSEIIILKKFSLDASTSVKSITCTKGKTTKKVSGTNPKCPKGYKVKA